MLQTKLNIFLWIIFSAVACDTLEPNRINNDSTELVEVIIKNDWPNDEINFNSVTLNGDNLNANLSYSGGCKTHKFVLVISTAFEKSNPPQTEMFLSHENNNDNCEAYLSEEIKFDLSGLKEVYIKRYGRPGTIILKLLDYGNFTYSFH